MKSCKLVSVLAFSGVLMLGTVLVPSGARAQTKAAVVEEIIARVNNDIITMSDYQKAEDQLREEVAHDCQGCSQDRLMADFKDQQKDLLRGLIDQSLMVQRAKDMGISVESDVIKRLDDVRKQNGLASMEDLEKAVESSGLAWEDYKTQIRNGLLTQEVMRREVGSHINIATDEVKQYYDAHPQEFTRPEQVVLAEIFLSTDGKSPEEIASVQRKAEDLRNRVMKGDDFNEIAKRYSEGSTAKDGGDLGHVQEGRTGAAAGRSGLQDGQGPDHRRDSDQDRIRNPESRESLSGWFAADGQSGKRNHEPAVHGENAAAQCAITSAQLREESYVMVKPGYIDTAAVAGASVIQEVQPTPDVADEEEEKKKLPLPKVNGQ